MHFPKLAFTKQGESRPLHQSTFHNQKMNFKTVAQCLAISAMIAMFASPLLNFLNLTKVPYIVVSMVCGVFMLCTEFPVFSFIFAKESRCGRLVAVLQTPIYKCCSYAVYSVAISLSMGTIFAFSMISPILTLLASICYGASIFFDRKEASGAIFGGQSSDMQVQRTESSV